MGTGTCEVACSDGYSGNGGTAAGACLADVGATTASYQGIDLVCSPATCHAPALGTGVAKGTWCEDVVGGMLLVMLFYILIETMVQ